MITCVGDAHLGGFGSRQHIAQSKAELLAALPADGRAVLGDDPWLRNMPRDCRAESSGWARRRAATSAPTTSRAARGRLSFRVEDCQFAVPVWGRHHLTAALAAVAVGRMMGFDLDEIARRIA